MRVTQVFSPHDELKAVPLADLQEAIAKAVTERLGVRVRCDISEIDFSSTGGVTATIALSAESMYDMLEESDS
jgi:hypothetical protein